MKLAELESILEMVAESCDRLDQRMQNTKDAYERMNYLAHQQLWSPSTEIGGLDLVLECDATFGRQLLAPLEAAGSSGQLLLREKPAIRLPELTEDARPKWLETWRNLSQAERVQLEDYEANMATVNAADRLQFRLTQQEVAETRRRDCHCDSLLHFRQVCRVNAQRWGLGAALFTRASKLTHSCRPNCYTSEDGFGALELRSLRCLEPKEVLTISYMADEKLLLQDTQSRRRYLWSRHCFHCRCSRCTADDTAPPLAPALKAAVQRWRSLESRVGNLLKPKELELRTGWRDLWLELIIWQHENVLPENHWATAHAGLLASYMALQRHSMGFPWPLRVAQILQGFSDFFRLHREVCPEVWWLTTEVQAHLSELRAILQTDLEDEILTKRCDLALLLRDDMLQLDRMD